MHTTRLSRRRALAALGATASPWLWAQSAMQGRPIDTQGRPIPWLVGQPAGGTTDVLTRVVARALAHQLDQAVIVENRPGVAGAIALQAAAKAAQDGLTLVSIPGPTLTHIPRPQIGKEMTAVAILARGPMVLVGTMATALPPTLEGLLAAARKNPGGFELPPPGQGPQPASDRRVAQPTRPDADDAYSIQGRRPGRHGSGRRPSAIGAARHHPGAAPYQSRQAARIWHIHGHALGPVARCAHFAGSRPARLQCRSMVCGGHSHGCAR